MAKVRAHVMLPKELIEEVDEIVGRRRRSEFFAEAAERLLRNWRLSRALQRIRENDEPVDVEGWDDPEKWVRDQRALDKDPWTDVDE